MIAVNMHVRRTRSLEVPSPPPFPSPPLPPGQINYLSKKNHLSRLLREQQAAVSQIIRELRAIRGSLEVIDGIHEELQTATDDYSTTSYATPYYSYLVKRLPIESNSNKAASRSEVNGLFTGHQGTASSCFDTSSAGEETTSTTDRMADIDEQITMYFYIRPTHVLLHQFMHDAAFVGIQNHRYYEVKNVVHSSNM